MCHSDRILDNGYNDSAQENSGESRDREKGPRLRMKEDSGLRDSGSMDATGYAIKLYGQGSSDS